MRKLIDWTLNRSPTWLWLLLGVVELAGCVVITSGLPL